MNVGMSKAVQLGVGGAIGAGTIGALDLSRKLITGITPQPNDGSADKSRGEVMRDVGRFTAGLGIAVGALTGATMLMMDTPHAVLRQSGALPAAAGAVIGLAALHAYVWKD